VVSGPCENEKNPRNKNSEFRVLSITEGKIVTVAVVQV
jgi:hypothetical protein